MTLVNDMDEIEKNRPLCACGCGKKTKPYTVTDKIYKKTYFYGYKKYILNHNLQHGKTSSKRRKSYDKGYNHANLKPSTELAYILGVNYGDGWICEWKLKTGRMRRSISLQVTDKDFADNFKMNIDKLFIRKIKGNPCKLSPRGKGKKMRYHYSRQSNNLFFFLKQPLDSHKKTIEHNKKTMAAFLKGFYDSEGSVLIDKRGITHGIEITNTNKQIIYYIKYLLRNYFFIDAKWIKPRNNNTGSFNKNKKSKKLYRLSISYAEGIFSFKNNINFSIERKQKRLENIKQPIKIRRLTIDLDKEYVHHLDEILVILKQKGFEEITVKKSPSKTGYHIFCWHPIGFFKTELLQLRKDCYDDKIRIYLDSFSNRAINVLFDEKIKKETCLKDLFKLDEKIKKEKKKKQYTKDNKKPETKKRKREWYQNNKLKNIKIFETRGIENNVKISYGET